MDLIERQAAIKDAESWVAVDEYEKHLQKNVIEWLKEFPPASPEIVRCKDCKYWKFDHTCREHSLVSPMMANEFCSRAERREDG